MKSSLVLNWLVQSKSSLHSTLNSVKYYKLSKPVGIDPSKLLQVKCTSIKDVIFPIQSGIDPLKLLFTP